MSQQYQCDRKKKTNKNLRGSKSFFAIRKTMLTTDKVLKRRPYFEWMLQIRYHFIHRIARVGVGLKINVD